MAQLGHFGPIRHNGNNGPGQHHGVDVGSNCPNRE